VPVRTLHRAARESVQSVPRRAARGTAPNLRVNIAGSGEHGKLDRETFVVAATLGAQHQMRPIIGLTSSSGFDTHADPPREQSSVLTAYTDAVFAAGAIPHPVPIPARYDDALLDELLAGFDGLIFTGGPDLNPRHYGQAVHPKTKAMAGRRDLFELDFFKRADAAGAPILAICLGHQVAHVARGGGLIQHVDDVAATPHVTHYGPPAPGAFHQVQVTAGSRLAEIVRGSHVEVNSRHHQAADARRPARGLRPVAVSPDGVLEAAEDCDGRFLLTVQWHPEDLIDRPEHLRLFEALAAEAREWGRRGRSGGAQAR
jgi:putative glutamine amidotransferase